MCCFALVCKTHLNFFATMSGPPGPPSSFGRCTATTGLPCASEGEQVVRMRVKSCVRTAESYHHLRRAWVTGVGGREDRGFLYIGRRGITELRTMGGIVSVLFWYRRGVKFGEGRVSGIKI